MPVKPRHDHGHHVLTPAWHADYFLASMCEVTQQARGLLGVMPMACASSTNSRLTSSSTSALLQVGCLYRPRAPRNCWPPSILAGRAEADRFSARHDEEGRAVRRPHPLSRVCSSSTNPSGRRPRLRGQYRRSSPTTRRALRHLSSHDATLTTVHRVAIIDKGRPRSQEPPDEIRPERDLGSASSWSAASAFREGLSWWAADSPQSASSGPRFVARLPCWCVTDPRHPAVRDHVAGGSCLPFSIRRSSALAAVLPIVGPSVFLLWLIPADPVLSDG